MKENSEEKNVVFLDFDGVINVRENDYGAPIANNEAIYYLNKLCLETGFSIVVCSSWRNHINYKDFLYNSGLDKRIKILGKTDTTKNHRGYEIIKYIEDNDVNKFIIIDDAYYPSEYGAYHVQPATRLGFTKNKYEEALKKISNFE